MLPLRQARGLRCTSLIGASSLSLVLVAGLASAQTPSPNANTPTVIPAGAIPVAAKPDAAAVAPTISARKARDADDAYLEGAKHIEKHELAAAERSFARAVQLNPTRQEYIHALAVAREAHVTELVQTAARARQNGDGLKSEKMLSEAVLIDPENRVANQHLAPNIAPPDALYDTHIAETLAGPIEFKATPGKQSFHRRGDPQDLTRAVYAAFGIKITFDDSVNGGQQINFDLDDVDFAAATKVLQSMTHLFVVPLQPDFGIAAKDTEENRERLIPQVEETIYLPGISADAMTELANVARNIFELKQVTASASAGKLLLRGDQPTLRLVNATYADMLDGGSDVLLDIHLYEVSKNYMRQLGTTLPSSVGAFDLLSTAQNLLNANQSIITAAVQSGALNLTGLSNSQIQLAELLFLIKSGVSGASQFANLFGTLGTYAGLPLAGIYVTQGATFNALLTSSEVRVVDSVTLRGADRLPLNFRAGTRYPVVTATYSSGISSSLASQLAGVNINGTSASKLLAQYLGSSTTSIPQFQFEDLGLTLKATPHVLHTGEISLQLELKLEALGGGSLNSIPILNSRSLTSSVTVPVGKTALLISEVNSSEIKSIDGVPGLSELPGFQGTAKNVEHDTGELLITITPHVVRPGNMHIASRVLSTGPSHGGGSQ